MYELDDFSDPWKQAETAPVQDKVRTLLLIQLAAHSSRSRGRSQCVTPSRAPASPSSMGKGTKSIGSSRCPRRRTAQVHQFIEFLDGRSWHYHPVCPGVRAAVQDQISRDWPALNS